MNKSKLPHGDNFPEPRKKLLRKRNASIRSLYKKGYSMREVAIYLGHSKSTVFYAIRGR